jgi:hypothetical protein
LPDTDDALPKRRRNADDKLAIERATAEQWCSWFSQQTGRLCRYVRPGDDPPDVICEIDGMEVAVEVTTAYYDDRHARMLRRHAKPAVNRAWFASPDSSLVRDIRTQIAKKAQKSSKSDVLLLYVRPPLTTLEVLVEQLVGDDVPTLEGSEMFSGVYIVGQFPCSTDSVGGERVLPLKPLL